MNGSPLHACGRISQDLVHRRAATAHVGAEARVLGLGPAEPEAEDQPAVAEQLDRRRVLGQAQRVMHRREDDARADLDPRRRLRERGADDEERGHVAVVDEVVLGRPDGREAESLRFDGQADRVVVGPRPVGLAGPRLRAEQSKAKSHGGSVPRPALERRATGPHRVGPVLGSSYSSVTRCHSASNVSWGRAGNREIE